MAKRILGIDIGSSTLKLALCEGNKILRMAEEHMPDNLVSDGRIISPEAMADFLKTAIKKNKLRNRLCAVILPAAQVFVRQTELPLMSEDQLRLNLPYEFRDYISDERDKYFYDYYVVNVENDAEGEPAKLELVAAAARKELIASYNSICRWAGMKLVSAIPMEMALVNLIRRSASSSEGELGEQCFIDLGHTGTRIYFFQGERFDAVRTADRGGAAADGALAEAMNVDVHIAQSHKEATVEDEPARQALFEVYREIATDIMRAVNFYNYNNHENELNHGWVCGGGSHAVPLCSEIQDTLHFQLLPISGMIPGSPDELLSSTCFAAIGAAIQ